MFRVGDEVHVGFTGRVIAQELVQFNAGTNKLVSKVHIQNADGSVLTAYVTDEALSFPLVKRTATKGE